jgi:hypothetical protein
MAFDQSTRNRLAHFVNASRELLTKEFTRQLQNDYGLNPETGEVAELDRLTHLDDSGRETARVLRETMAHHLANETSTGKKGSQEVLTRIVREQAFTVLNRICALRMAEARGLLIESVARGYQSQGFELYANISGSALGDRGETYANYLLGVLDEFAIDLPVLFDRFSPQGRLFPREAVLLELLGEVNDPEIDGLWSEDETIGWIYQYFNTKEERKVMRDASSAPRNSRELAVRNQFFTPRYVVEFLTDNTLGRIWYEMTQGQTRLADQCRYLVRRPTEIFLTEGEVAPVSPEGDTEETLSQEELLKQPVHIPHRQVKDPREIRLLDPACGSMHFGLYAFDLFEAIYEEAWDNGLCPALQDAYPSKDDYLRDVPRLIIEHNIHGVDIDPRAVQIAGLSLWLRAQKAWQDRGVMPADRPRVLSSNIVCAEPMPGSEAMLEDFVQTLDPPLLGQFVKTVFDKMQLAGEAGALLKIEEEIRTAIDQARGAWEKLQRQSPELFSIEELNRVTDQQEMSGLDKSLLALRSLGEEGSGDFFDTAEERIYAALRDYAESAEAGDYQRRLFTEDAAHGFAFIDLCRRRYDAVVMNPPFGANPKSTKRLLANAYFAGRTDLYACFILRALELTGRGGAIGAITARTGFFLQSFSEWRTNLLSKATVTGFADLGGGVLDTAMVETAAYVLSTSAPKESPFIRLEAERKDKPLRVILDNLSKGTPDQRLFVRNPEVFAKLPDQAWAYWIPAELSMIFAENHAFDPSIGDIRLGVQTNDDFRFSRIWWEVPPEKIGVSSEESSDGRGWVSFLKGGKSSKYCSDVSMVLNWFDVGAELKAAVTIALHGGHWSRHIQSVEYFFLPGVSWALRTDNFDPHLVPGGCISSISRYFAIPNQVSIWSLLAIWNIPLFDFLAKLRMEKWVQPKFVTGVVKDLPFPELTKGSHDKLASLALSVWNIRSQQLLDDETSRYMRRVEFDRDSSLSGLTAGIARARRDAIDTAQNTQEEIDTRVLQSFGCHWSGDTEVVQVTDPSQVSRNTKEGESGESIAGGLLSFIFGCSLGRWDIRYATGERQPPELPAPFDPLPVCPPGMLQNTDALPAAPADVPDNYPLRITWPGILVVDDGHAEDIVARVRDALTVIWGDRSAAIEQEACEILGVRTPRDYFAEKKSGGGFFRDHLKRYSKSRRQAPIYWPLSTASGTYTLWLYYHRLDDQTLYSCVNDFIEPKLKQVTDEATQHRVKQNRSSAEERDLERVTDLAAELHEFRDQLLEIAKIWKPNLNDGVQITAAPLWRFFRLKKWQTALRQTWEKLEAGDYDWAHLSLSIWPERVVRASHKDRSLAIAHDLEDKLWEEAEAKGQGRGGKARTKLEWKPRDLGEVAFSEIVANVRRRYLGPQLRNR